MTNFKATMMHRRRDAEGQSTFEAMDALMEASPVHVVRAFMEWVEGHAGLGNLDYERNVAYENKAKGVVTALGSLQFEGGDEEPFNLYISRA